MSGDEVKARIDVDSRNPYLFEIAVSAPHGTVLLRGSVGSFRQRRGVGGITNEIMVITAGFDG